MDFTEQININHDGLVVTDARWLDGFRVQVADTFGQCKTASEFLVRYNYLIPEFDRETSTAYLNLNTALQTKTGHCLTAALSLGEWGVQNGMYVSYFPRSVVQHAVVGLSEKQIIVPDDSLDMLRFTDLWQRNARKGLALYEHKQHMVGLDPFHRLNFTMLTNREDRFVREPPQLSSQAFLQRMGWWQGEHMAE
ncbi:MAG: hypothetical protein NUV65_01300 [Candidatus Roizmanbacteria bacterium]|nr:hypothetical protein [Candidatus Roizmanbacteria bacterium]